MNNPHTPSWAEAAHLHLVDAHLLLAVPEPDRPADAIELSAASGVSLDAVYPALRRLIGRGYVREEHRRYALTVAGHGLVDALDRSQRSMRRPSRSDDSS